MRHLDRIDKSELRELQLLKDELGGYFVFVVDYMLFWTVMIYSLLHVSVDYCKLYLLFLLENKDEAVYGFRHSTFFFPCIMIRNG